MEPVYYVTRDVPGLKFCNFTLTAREAVHRNPTFKIQGVTVNNPHSTLISARGKYWSLYRFFLTVTSLLHAYLHAKLPRNFEWLPYDALRTYEIILVHSNRAPNLLGFFLQLRFRDEAA